MRFEVYDEENKLFRKFWTRWEAARFVQPTGLPTASKPYY